MEVMNPVECYPVEPGTESVQILELRQIPERGHENVLSQVLGIHPGPCAKVYQTENLVLMDLDQLLKAFLSCPGLHHKRGNLIARSGGDPQFKIIRLLHSE